MDVVGIDTSKATLTCWHKGRVVTVKNQAKECTRFLRTLPPASLIGIEATGAYHFVLADRAVAMGFQVYVLNPADAAMYRQALRSRGKTDLIDCEMIARFVSKEHDDLRPYAPLPEHIKRLRSLIRRRDKAVKAKTLLEQSTSHDKEVTAIMRPSLCRLKEAIRKMEGLISRLCREVEGYENVSTIPAIGPVNRATLLCALNVGAFKSADAFIAFCGLDCRPKESGTFAGKRKLTKRGNAVIRKNLYMAAMCGRGLTAWQPYYKMQLAKGLATTQALVALSRKMARTAWSVYTHRTKFDCARISSLTLDIPT